MQFNRLLKTGFGLWDSCCNSSADQSLTGRAPVLRVGAVGFDTQMYSGVLTGLVVRWTSLPKCFPGDLSEAGQRLNETAVRPAAVL